MPKKTRQNTPKFYHVSTMSGQDWATEIEPISAVRAKHCMSCDRQTGVFFRDSGPNWLLTDPLTIRDVSPTIQCFPCWMANDGPCVVVDKKGQLQKPYRETIIFAKDKFELAKLVKLWKHGKKLLREVGTAHGSVLVFGFLEEQPPGVGFEINCPHCKGTISLTVNP